jgi:hypothetical protein
MLQEGLRQSEAPTVTAGFNDKVRARLRRPEPWWLALLNACRPIAAPAACSLAVTLALLIVMGAPRTGGSSNPGAQGVGNIALDPGGRANSIEPDLDRLDRDIPSLSGFRRAARKDVRQDERQETPILHRGTSYRRSDRANRV